jgi:hypothetical protein
MTRRYEQASTAVTGNKGFEKWGEISSDEVTDRLVHHYLVTIRGNSYRMRQHIELWHTLVISTTQPSPSGCPFVEIEKPAEPWTSTAAPAMSRSSSPTEAFFFDRSHESRDQHDADVRVPEQTSYITAPFPIPIADQHVRRAQHIGFGYRERPDDLLHEHGLRIWRRSEDLHAAGGQIDDEHVVRDQTLPRPDFRREEIGAGDHSPMRVQKRLPRGRALRDRRQPVVVQDAGDRGSADAMSDILQRALNPSVAPRGILSGHSHDQSPDLGEDPAPSGFLGVRPFRAISQRSNVSGVATVAISRTAAPPTR